MRKDPTINIAIYFRFMLSPAARTLVTLLQLSRFSESCQIDIPEILSHKASSVVQQVFLQKMYKFPLAVVLPRSRFLEGTSDTHENSHDRWYCSQLETTQRWLRK